MYKLCKDPFGNINNCVLRLVDHIYVPTDPDNTDYQQYLAWLEAGNTPLPADENSNA